MARRRHQGLRWAGACLASSACHSALPEHTLGLPFDIPVLTTAESSAGRAPDELSRLMAQVAHTRALQPVALPSVVALPTAELAARALEEIRHTAPPEVWIAHAQLLVRLELVPHAFEWWAALEVALRGRLRAFYAPEARCIFIDRALVGQERDAALAHELVHALQEQHHALSARLQYQAGAWDSQATLHALAEGDAEALLARLPGFAPAEASEASGTAEADMPAMQRPAGILLRSLDAAYVDGRQRVEDAYAAGGWSSIDALLRDPPLTSHELLHPLLTRSRGPEDTPNRAPYAPNGAWQLTYSDALGEQALRIVLEEWLSSALAAETASAWVDDRVASFVRAESLAVSWQWQFDTPGAALAAWRASVDGLRLPVSRGQPAHISPRSCSCRAQQDGGVVGACLAGRHVSLASLVGPDAALTCATLTSWMERLN